MDSQQKHRFTRVSAAHKPFSIQNFKPFKARKNPSLPWRHVVKPECVVQKCNQDKNWRKHKNTKFDALWHKYSLSLLIGHFYLVAVAMLMKTLYSFPYSVPFSILYYILFLSPRLLWTFLPISILNPRIYSLHFTQHTRLCIKGLQELTVST